LETFRRIMKTLRSRRLAVWLLTGLTAYVAVLTVLQIPNPYSNPAFIAAVAVLTLSTGACAWERTSGAIRLGRRAAEPPAEAQVRAAGNAVAVAPGLPDDEVCEAASAAFAACGLRTQADGNTVTGSANGFGAWGSPVFHWGLTALFLLAALGQLMRAEGRIDLVVGRSAPDAASSYVRGSYAPAPLFMDRFTGASIGLESIALDYSAGGTDRGDAPVVTVSDGGRVVERRHVYPNSPAAYGPLTIHRDIMGPAALVTLRFPNGEEAASIPVVFAQAAQEGTAPVASLSVENKTNGQTDEIRFEVRTGKRVVASIPARGFESPPLAEGEGVDLPDGTRLVLVAATSFARLRVVNDWTVPCIYLAFVLVILGPLVSIFWPPRRAAAVLVPEDGVLCVRVAQRKSDPAFRSKVESAVRERIAALAGADPSAQVADDSEEKR
jgi:cytochrome c biogenesis protein ResB